MCPVLVRLFKGIITSVVYTPTLMHINYIVVRIFEPVFRISVFHKRVRIINVTILH